MSLWQTGLQIVGIFGGGAVVTAAVVGFMGKIFVETFMRKSVQRHERDLELLKQEYQIDLEGRRTIYKKSEFIFEKQFEAANRLLELRLKHIPLPWHPDVDHQDLLDRTIENAEMISNEFRAFLSKFGAILSKKEREELDKLASKARELAFYCSTTSPDQNSDIAETILSEIQELEERFIGRVLNQSRAPSQPTEVS